MTLAGSDNSVLTFTAPVLNSTGYLPLVLTYVQSSRTAATPTNWTGLDWLYYTSVECDTGLIVGLYCTPCPTGGYCPGGGRVWPLPGYWSFDERSVPVACSLPQACPGALCSPPTVKADGSRQTSVCAVGYAGSYCVECAADYYSDLQRCLSCGLEEQELTELVVLLCIFAALFLALAVAVATAHANKLSTAVSAVLVVQHLSVVGKLAGQQVPASLTWLVQAFSIISMLNFDIQFVKPGCVVGALSFLSVYWCTIGLLCCASLLFTAASVVRALLSRRAAANDSAAVRADMVRRLSEQAEARGLSRAQARRRSALVVAAAASPQSAASDTAATGNGADWRWRFRARVVHSHLILGSILYLRLTTMGFQAIHCTDVLQSDGSYRSLLEIDMSTPCYVGAHLYSSLFIWPMLLLNSVAFPLLCFRLLYRNFHGSVSVLRSVTPVMASMAADDAMSRATSADVNVLSRSARSEAGEVEMSQLPPLKGIAELQSPLLSDCPSPGGPTLSSPLSTRALLSRRALASYNSSDESADGSGGGSNVEDDSRPPLAYTTLHSPSINIRTIDEVSTAGRPNEAAASGEVGGWRSPPQRSSHRLIPSRTTSTRRIVPIGHVRSDSELPTVKSMKGLPFSFSSASRNGNETSDMTRKQQVEAAKLALRQLGKDLRRQEMLGYMYRQLKGELYYFRLLFFATSFGFAAVSVLPSDPTLRLFLTGVFLMLDLFTTCSLTPFERWWRNVLSSVVSLFGVLQIFAMLTLVEMGISTGDGGSVSLGHSTTAQQQSTDPSGDLTGASDKAGRYQLYLGILLCVDVLAVAAVHRKKIVLAMRWLKDALRPHARRLYERCVCAAVAVRDGGVRCGRATRAAGRRVAGWLTGLTRVIELTGEWVQRGSLSESDGWAETSMPGSTNGRRAAAHRLPGPALTINTAAERRRVQYVDEDSSAEQPMDDEVELEQEWQRLAQYTELLSPRNDERHQADKTTHRPQLELPADEPVALPQPRIDASEREETGEGANAGRSNGVKVAVPPLALSVLTGPLSPASIVVPTNDATMRSSPRYVINPARRVPPPISTVELTVHSGRPPSTARSPPLSPYSAPTRAMTSRATHRSLQPTSPHSGTQRIDRPSTPSQQQPSSVAAVCSPSPVRAMVQPQSPQSTQRVERASSAEVAMPWVQAAFLPSAHVAPQPVSSSVELTVNPQQQQQQQPQQEPTHNSPPDRLPKPRGRPVRATRSHVSLAGRLRSDSRGHGHVVYAPPVASTQSAKKHLPPT